VSLEKLDYVQLGDGFLAIGGFEDPLSVDTVYKFNQDYYGWSLLDSKLGVPRDSTTSVALPDDFLLCVDN